MTKLEQLLAEYCPEGVEYRKLGEVATLSRGRVMSKGYLRDNFGEYPVYSSQTENNGEFGTINSYDFDGQFITWTTDGANAGSVFYRDGKFSITNVCGLIEVVSELFDTKFLYYYLTTEAKKHVNSGMGNPKLMSNVMEKIRVPLPPLAAQREIVRILDNFSLLSENLAEELAARKKQYEYYRDKLLTFGEDVPRMKLGEVCTIFDSKRKPVTKGKRVAGDYPYYGANGIQDYVDNYIFDGTYLLVGEDGSVLNLDGSPVLVWASGKIWVNNHAHVLGEKPGTLLRYLFYVLQTLDITDVVRGVPPKLNQENLRNLKIPVPPLAEQERIVKILDKFDTLCHDLTIGLPAEIEARKKQYEYYRDKLLRFEATHPAATEN